MNKTLRFSLLSMLMMLCGSVFADNVTVTFTAGTDKGTTTAEAPGADQITKDGVTIAISNGAMATDQYRVYKGQTFTVSSSVGNITKIEVTCTANGIAKQGPGCLENPTTGSYSFESDGKNGTWTGNAAEVQFSTPSNQCRMTNIVVTVGEGGDTPGPGPDPEFQTVANIAAFKALANGTEAKLTLNNAEVLYAGTNDIYVRDASGAIDFYKAGLSLTTGNVLNGSVIGKYTLYNTTPEFVSTSNTNDNDIQQKAGNVQPKAISPADAAKYICDLVKISGATIVSRVEGTYTNTYAVVGSQEVQVYDKFKVVKGEVEEGKTYDIVGIVIPFKESVEICPISDYTDGSTPGPGPDPEIKTVDNIAAFKALAKGTEATLTLKDAEVLYVNGTNDIYVRDASGAIDFFRTGLTYTAGQKLNGSVTGKYDLYQNTPELVKSDNTNGDKITATNGTVTAKSITAAEVKNNICDLVKLTGVTVTENEGKFYIDDVQIYDKFKVLNGKPVSGNTYDIEGIAIMFNDVVEICPVSDYTAGSTPAELTISGETTFEESTVVTIIPSDVDHDVYYTLDGTDPKTSSTQKRYMEPFTIKETCTVKAWEEDADIYAEKTFTKKAIETISVEDVIAAAPESSSAAEGQEKVWVKGYIVGFVEGQVLATGAKFTNEGCETKSNLLIATEAFETDLEKCIPIQLPAGVVREGLNLQDNPDNFGKEVMLLGHVLKYFGVPGMRNVTEFRFTGNNSVELLNVDNMKDGKMYNIAGQRVNDSFKGIVIMNGKKFIVK